MIPTYTSPTVAISTLPLVETWSDVRCPACVPLGWEMSRLLFKVFGAMTASGATLQVRCPRCKSLVSWRIGTPELRAVSHGPKNNKQRKVVFE